MVPRTKWPRRDGIDRVKAAPFDELLTPFVRIIAVLTIRLPLREEAKPRQIKVDVAA